MGFLLYLLLVTDVNASRWPGDQSEVSIALDRFNGRRILAAAMNLNEGGLLTMASDDAGENWSRGVLPLPTGAAWHADPMVAFDSRGSAFLAVIPVARDNTALGIELLRSDDSGRTWSAPVRISKATGRDDKVALAVDDGPRSRYRDRIHVAWKWPSGGIFYSSSDDGARRFSRPRLIEVAAVSGIDLAVTSDGELYVAASDGGERVMRVIRSTDGGGSFLPSVAVAPVRAEWYTSQPSHCRRQSIVHASISVDRSEGSRLGAVYLTWSDSRGGSESELRRPVQSADRLQHGGLPVPLFRQRADMESALGAAGADSGKRPLLPVESDRPRNRSSLCSLQGHSNRPTPHRDRRLLEPLPGRRRDLGVAAAPLGRLQRRERLLVPVRRLSGARRPGRAGLRRLVRLSRSGRRGDLRGASPIRGRSVATEGHPSSSTAAFRRTRASSQRSAMRSSARRASSSRAASSCQSRSRPLRTERARPASASTRKCFATACRVTSVLSVSRAIESGPSLPRRATRRRRVWSPRAAKTGASDR